MHELEEGRCTDEFRQVRTVSMPRALVPDPARNWSHAQPCQGYVPLAPGWTTMSAMVASRSWPDERKRRLGGRSCVGRTGLALGLPRPARATGRRPVSAPICAVCTTMTTGRPFASALSGKGDCNACTSRTRFLMLRNPGCGACCPGSLLSPVAPPGFGHRLRSRVRRM